MVPMIPDCGIFTTLRREPPLRILLGQDGLDDSHPLSQTITATSPSQAPHLLHASPTSPELSNKNLNSGLSFALFKSPKNVSSPMTRVEMVSMGVRGVRRPKGDGINKGVGHKIKKTKLKAKEKLKKGHSIKPITKRLKEGAYTPYLPSTRSPIKITGSKLGKKRTLTSPGMSLLDEEGEVEINHFIPKPRFFTTKNRAAATVQISKNIRLSAKYGDVTLKQREGGFTKKNIGRRVEDELHQYLEQSCTSPSVNVSSAHSLPSMLVNPRPVPTRVPGTPSPIKKPQVKTRPRAASPKKGKRSEATTKLNRANIVKVNTEEGELLDLEKIFGDWDDDSESGGGSPTKFRTMKTSRNNDFPSTPTQRSRKTGDVETPRRRSLRKLGDVTASPSRSPRISKAFSTPTRTARTMKDCTESPARSPRISEDCATPTRRTPCRLDNGTSSSLARSPSRKVKECRTPTRTSPRKALALSSGRMSSPKRQQSSPEKTAMKVGIPEAQSKTKSSPNNTSGKVKMFPIFDPKQRRSDQVVMGSSEKNSVRLNTKMVVAENDMQMTLDAGQKRFGIEQCTMCGVVYEIANPSDEANHKYHHDKIINSIKFLGWKKERRVRDVDHLGARVVMVSGDDPKNWWCKVEEVLEMVDTELGFPLENRVLVKESTKVLLRIRDQRIVGCLIAENISKANRVIPQKKKDGGRLVCCLEESTKVWAGVGRIWVLPSERGKGHASTLVDCMRENMVPNFILSKDQIAFSDPTESGMIFAEKYTKRPDFLVYRRIV